MNNSDGLELEVCQNEKKSGPHDKLLGHVRVPAKDECLSHNRGVAMFKLLVDLHTARTPFIDTRSLSDETPSRRGTVRRNVHKMYTQCKHRVTLNGLTSLQFEKQQMTKIPLMSWNLCCFESSPSLAVGSLSLRVASPGVLSQPPLTPGRF